MPFASVICCLRVYCGPFQMMTMTMVLIKQKYIFWFSERNVIRQRNNRKSLLWIGRSCWVFLANDSLPFGDWVERNQPTATKTKNTSDEMTNFLFNVIHLSIRRIGRMRKVTKKSFQWVNRVGCCREMNSSDNWRRQKQQHKKRSGIDFLKTTRCSPCCEKLVDEFVSVQNSKRLFPSTNGPRLCSCFDDETHRINKETEMRLR